MNPNTSDRVHVVGPLLIACVGLGLLVYMVSVEGEPGALPLVLLALGVGWYLVARARRRS